MTARETVALIASLAQTSSKPVPVEVQHTHDGDTFAVYVASWPEPFQRMLVRLYGWDAPELKDKRPTIGAQAIKSLEVLRTYLALGGVVLTSIRPDKYFRLLSTVQAGHVEDVAAAMGATGDLRPYKGKGPKPW